MMEMMVYVAGGAAVLSIIIWVAKLTSKIRKIDKGSDLLKKEIEANKIIDGRLDDMKGMKPTTSSFREKSSSKPKIQYKDKSVGLVD